MQAIAVTTIISTSRCVGKANAQWIPTGKDVDGDIHYVSSQYWTLRSAPDIIIVYSKIGYDPSDRGYLTAVNCRKGAYTINVRGDGVRFSVPPDNQWIYPLYSTMGEALVEAVCLYK